LSKDLIIQDLTLRYRHSILVDRYSLYIPAATTTHLQKPSGFGKTLIAKAILGLLPPSITITSGSIYYNGINLLNLTPSQYRTLRVQEFGMIFQHPQTALNPTMRIKDQLLESIPISLINASLETLSLCPSILKKYPHQLSGGMCQRILILMTLHQKPSLLIADEPTTALDPDNTQQCLDLIHNFHKTEQCSLLLITHQHST
jgi:ABC-type dipeptide/oligopeptide/nickel transport system ATPase component